MEAVCGAFWQKAEAYPLHDPPFRISPYISSPCQHHVIVGKAGNAFYFRSVITQLCLCQTI